MITHSFSLAITFCVLNAASSFAETRPVTLAEVTGRVTKSNFFVLENAQRVYQAKSSIQLARRNLLPKINLWRAIDATTNPISLLGIVEDIAPFLVPNNWLRVKEEKEFEVATVYGYRALMANELLTARGLLLQASLEERLLEQLAENSVDLKGLVAIFRSREAMGAIPAGSSKQLEVRQLSLNSELNTLKRVIGENRSQLAFYLGYPGNIEAVPSSIQYTALTAITPLRFEDYDRRLATSYELRQFDSLIAVSKTVRRGRIFNFLGGSSQSRGTTGSVFDNLPQQDGLGFGLGPSVQIAKAQTAILEIQRRAVAETLRRNLKILVDSYNLDLQERVDAVQRMALTRSLWKTLQDRMKIGGEVNAFDLVEASRNRIEAVSNYHSVQTRLLLGLDRLNRLMNWDAYQAVEGPLP